ncbi:unnamed protein product [Calicophoron daubneyi]|uniref:Uncharacterized protein n=1 Tax=Calicophoron daubneyi TaxID=300641 RepID=A0AAV2TQM2_CALDB
MLLPLICLDSEDGGGRESKVDAAQVSDPNSFLYAWHPHHNRVRQWREAYRSSQSTTCASVEAIENWKPTSRALPDLPYANQTGRVPNSTEKGSPHSYGLRPPDLQTTGRASSFDGRCRPSELREPRRTSTRFPGNNPQFQPYWSPPVTSSRHWTSPKAPKKSEPSQISQKRERLIVAPSIEISLARDHSSSSEESVAEKLGGGNDRGGERYTSVSLKPSEFGSRPTPEEDQTNRTPSGLRNSLQPSSHFSSESMSIRDKLTLEKPRTRPRLTRQPRSFQADPLAPNNADSAMQSSNYPVDEFDYFCRIANSPSGSKLNTPSKPPSGTRPQNKHAPAIRSHSMRATSPEDNRPCLERRPEARSSERLAGTPPRGMLSREESRGPFLKPPGRGQLRRASTEEQRYKDHLPVAATLSYSSANSYVQNSCMTPPKSIAPLPPCPTDLPSPSMPLGVPLSADALFADEPGMTYYQVQVLGALGVGKTSLCQQLSSLMTGKSQMFEVDEDITYPESRSVTAALRGSLYTVNFVDSSAESFEVNLEIKIHDCIDAFIVMYAIDDSSSFDAARIIMNALSPVYDTSQSPTLSPRQTNAPILAPALILLVANKADLVRGRQVTTEEGRNLATAHDAKFIEVSASLNHMVAELFIELINQLRDSEQRGRDPRLPTERRTGLASNSGHASSALSKSTASQANTSNFRIPASAKSSLSKFFKKHFTRTSEDDS